MATFSYGRVDIKLFYFGEKRFSIIKMGMGNKKNKCSFDSNIKSTNLILDKNLVIFHLAPGIFILIFYLKESSLHFGSFI